MEWIDPASWSRVFVSREKFGIKQSAATYKTASQLLTHKHDAMIILGNDLVQQGNCDSNEGL